MIRLFRPAVLLCIVALWLPASAVAQPVLEPAGSGIVVEVADGDTLTLDNGTVVRLVGLQAPKLPLGRKGFQAWPLADESKAALEKLVLNRRVTLSYGGRRTDRYGRALAHLHDENGVWIQGELLRLGMARVYTFRDNTALVMEMLALERQARAAGKGIWSDTFYHIRHHDRLQRYIDSFQLVEGRVRRVARARGNIYLNFGNDWRTDFTLFVASADRRRLERGGKNFATLEGQMIRVRGWLKFYNGPSIKVDHWEQIEVFE